MSMQIPTTSVSLTNSLNTSKKSQQNKGSYKPIQIRGKKTYGTSNTSEFVKGCFCASALDAEDDQSLLTSKNRKYISKQLISQFKSKNPNAIEDPLQIVIRLYIDDHDELLYTLLNKTRINPNLSVNHYWRDDLEFYIPQICNFFVFHEEVHNPKLKAFLKKAGTIDFYFAHMLCFYLRSLTLTVTGGRIEELSSVTEVLDEFTSCFKSYYSQQRLLAVDLTKNIINNDSYSNSNLKENKGLNNTSISKSNRSTYGTNDNNGETIETIPLNNYISLKNQNGECNSQNEKSVEDPNSVRLLENQIPSTVNQIGRKEGKGDGFQSTINFLEDLIGISSVLGTAENKLETLKSELRIMNERLPSAVYMPFFEKRIRNCAILGIVADECKVFSTKERTPFYICMELFRPKHFATDSMDDEVLSRPRTTSNRLKDLSESPTSPENATCQPPSRKNSTYNPQDNSSSQPLLIEGGNGPNDSMVAISKTGENKQEIFDIDCNQSVLPETERILSIRILNDNLKGSEIRGSINFANNVSGISCVYEKQMRMPSQNSFMSSDSLEEGKIQMKNVIGQDEEIGIPKMKSVVRKKKDGSGKFKGIGRVLFGEDSYEQEKRIRKASKYGHLDSWRLVHLIVKTGDNMKQEQLAVQLIYQFQQIFRVEGVGLRLRPYEIVSIGPECGVLEMVKDSITLDGLKKTIHEQYKGIRDLHQFFQVFYGEDIDVAQQNFCSSLVAYSLVCYFLQIKDRHNGNILLHKDGHICHIDFGFFLSNAPGKGLAFEQNVPFKLLSEYIEILGGVESELFQNFRKLFFKGFQAAQKHQDKILILIKMLYSGHGSTLPCFEKGEQCILDLEQRFNPPNISNDGELSLHCNMLINQSLDNWRARWYDKWQYYCQGIFY